MINGLRVLISNDDGITASGLAVLEKIAHTISDDVWTVAPETEQSGASHSLTINQPLRLRQVDRQRYAVMGTPTDCVMLAVFHLMRDQKRPDIILSGINIGANLGEDVTYSGTVAAAMEGALLGIRSISLSQVLQFDDRDQNIPQWDTSEKFGADIISKLVSLPFWPPGVFMNVNFPDVHPDKVIGIETTVQGQRDTANLKIDERLDARGEAYYWIGYRDNPKLPKIDTDFDAIARGAISISPLGINMSDSSFNEQIRAVLK